MGTLATELAPHVSGAPRIYADANIPNGVVHYMRTCLRWDVFFVLEHEELRRARDIEHYRMARRLARTLVTQDRDYENDAMFPPGEGAGVIVLVAPDERRLCEMLALTDRDLFRGERAAALPLEGRKMKSHVGGSELLVVPGKESPLPEQVPAPDRLKTL
jgi:predicted nuclease of predicted toxin-antitoxin system